MNANAIVDDAMMADIERQKAEVLAPEIVRDLKQMAAEQEAIADKLPAELASISEQVSALAQSKAEAAEAHRQEIDRLNAEHAAEQADYDRQMARLMDSVLRRVSVKEQMLDRKTAAASKLLSAVDEATRALTLTADEAAAENHQTEEYGRLYREQYERAPEPPDDDPSAMVEPAAPEYTHATAGMDRPTRARDPGFDIMERELAHVVASLRGAAREPSLRDRVMRAGSAFLNPAPFVRRTPPSRAA